MIFALVRFANEGKFKLLKKSFHHREKVTRGETKSRWDRKHFAQVLQSVSVSSEVFIELHQNLSDFGTGGFTFGIEFSVGAADQTCSLTGGDGGFCPF